MLQEQLLLLTEERSRLLEQLRIVGEERRGLQVTKLRLLRCHGCNGCAHTSHMLRTLHASPSIPVGPRCLCARLHLRALAQRIAKCRARELPRGCPRAWGQRALPPQQRAGTRLLWRVVPRAA